MSCAAYTACGPALVGQALHGGRQHHKGVPAEALGRTVPASRYSPDLSLHPMLGSAVRERDVDYIGDWKDV